ncbi:protein spaetzle isoform X3 [Anastrepha ludens]|uniref:protein spaetzle isoform X3 n=1 Tax=Anastrepha ludens TaxID=28586 RepID=UPI0023AEE91E|nr:protein spaetzle isoform X3 [Anastrepha ludens]
MPQTSWPFRPVQLVLLLACLLLIINPIAADTYISRQKRTPYGNLARPQSGQNTKTTEDLNEKLDRIFKVGDGPGLVLFNTTTSGTPTNNNNNNINNRNFPPTQNNDALIFPDDEFICPERRQGKPYCTEVPNYMEATHLDRISPEKFAQFKPYFRDDLVQPQNVTQRMNSEPLEEYYCSSTSHLIYPKSAETKESKWLLVVQHEEHKQGILVEQCDNEEKPCRFEDSLPRFYTSKCKQHFVFRTMIVLVNGEMKEEQVKMPNCCKCVLRNTGARS